MPDAAKRLIRPTTSYLLLVLNQQRFQQIQIVQ